MILTKEQRKGLIYDLTQEDISYFRLIVCTDEELIDAAKSYGIWDYWRNAI